MIKKRKRKKKKGQALSSESLFERESKGRVEAVVLRYGWVTWEA
jgi:hypothetical protein